MKVKLSQAVKMFFGNSSFEMVLFEAVANSLDANATEINIDIVAKAFNQPESIEISIKDNGEGFTDERYRKFCKLFDVDEGSHKGLGRLVYLCYFENVRVESQYQRNLQRIFEFKEDFKEEDAIVNEIPDSPSGTNITMKGYTLARLRANAFITPAHIKTRLLQEFYSRFFKLKITGKIITIKINATIQGQTLSEELSNAEIPSFEFVELENSANLIDRFNLYFSIEKVEPKDTSLLAAISVDNRTINVEIIAPENVPLGFKMVFLLFSEYFTGKVDPSRQILMINDTEMQTIQTLFRKKVAAIIEERIPKIKETNKEIKSNLVNKFPHLSGYFQSDNIGYLARNEVLKKAQEQFFKAQKELLEASSLTDEQYEKSLELSARALTEYILFRQITIDQLKKTSKENSEAELHKLFSSMKEKFEGQNFVHDLYKNNAWLLDDKYVTYETVLSDREMSDLIKFITQDETIERDIDRPDIALVFSNNPDNASHFDVVIVELKKRGLTLEENMKTVTQLEKRARKLMEFYSNRIERIWYYGIVEFNEELELHLTGEYKELYSTGKMYYRETKVAIRKDLILPVGIFMWDIDSVVDDADARNSAFLKLIKSKFAAE